MHGKGLAQQDNDSEGEGNISGDEESGSDEEEEDIVTPRIQLLLSLFSSPSPTLSAAAVHDWWRWERGSTPRQLGFCGSGSQPWLASG